MDKTGIETIVKTGYPAPAEVTAQRDKNEYLQRIRELSPEDQAFMDGYLFAKVTERQKKGA